MIKNIPKAINKIVEELKDFTDNAIVGMSGGADSPLVAILCILALGKYNVYGYGMPYDKNDVDTFNSQSDKLAEHLDINYEELSIEKSVKRVAMDINPSRYYRVDDVNFGNIKSRMRMIFLYSLNACIAENTGKRCRVIGTGNLSEDFIGYDTKGGDALADIFPIGSLFKSEVYQLLDYFVAEGIIEDEMIDRVPSAGLEDGQTDEEDLGYSYDEMEGVIKFCLANYDQMDSINKTEILDFVWKKHLENKHKHEAPRVIDIGLMKDGTIGD